MGLHPLGESWSAEDAVLFRDVANPTWREGNLHFFPQISLKEAELLRSHGYFCIMACTLAEERRSIISGVTRCTSRTRPRCSSVQIR